MKTPKNVTLDMFVQSADFLHADQFLATPVLERLGPNMKIWLDGFLKDLGVQDEPIIHGHVHSGSFIQGAVYIAEGAVVEPTAYIQGPCFVGPNAVVRHGAYIRGYVYLGEKAVLGHASEIKGSIMMSQAKAAHFAYVGDSILCPKTNLGAGTRLANLKLRGDEVKYLHPETGEIMGSGIRKFGAVLGENVSTGCNAVISPGSLLLPNTSVFPCTHFHGTLTEGIAR